MNKQSEQLVNKRMERENVNGGELHVALIWNDIADLDLHVITPSGEELYYAHKESRCGGWLDIDMNAGGNFSLEPIENVFWASSPSGKYKIFVHNFNNRTDPGTVFTDPKRKVPYRVRLSKNGQVSWFDGKVGTKEKETCFEFNHNGSGALGSFVVLPECNEKKSIKELCLMNNIPFRIGDAYYKLVRTEKVSSKKDMLLHNTVSDTFTIGRIDCLEFLNLNANDNITIKKTDIPPNYELYIQSTSYNRIIQPNIKTLMRVSVRQALQNRRAGVYHFSDSEPTNLECTNSQIDNSLPSYEEAINMNQFTLENEQLLYTKNNENDKEYYGFDLDYTLIKPKGKNKFPKNVHDIELWNEAVIGKLKELNDSGFGIVIFSNQLNLLKEKYMSLEDWKKRLDWFLKKFDFPISIYISLKKDSFRKPEIGMFKKFNGNLKMYIGDAAGRPKDFSGCDRKFAVNCGVEFQTPDQFFLNKCEEPWEFDFNPNDIPVGNPFIINQVHCQEMVILVGSPTCGKSTFCKDYFTNYTRINQDSLKTKLKCLKETRKELGLGNSVVIDNTNPSKTVRKEYIDLAKEYNVPVRSFTFNPDKNLIAHLNIVRERETNCKRIPDIAYRIYFSKYEKCVPEEGFQEITNVPFILKSKSSNFTNLS